MLRIEEEVVRKVVSCAHIPFTRLATSNDDGQGYAQMLAFVRGNVPLVSVRQVFEHYLWNIEFLLVCPSVVSRIERQRREKQQH